MTVAAVAVRTSEISAYYHKVFEKKDEIDRAKAERDKKRKKEKETAEAYTHEQLAEIDACYEAETRRGSETRYFEDVEIGDELGRKVLPSSIDYDHDGRPRGLRANKSLPPSMARAWSDDLPK